MAGSPTIQIGSTDASLPRAYTGAVAEAQYYLVNLLYLPANTAPGVFGPIMMGATQAFQRMNGLAVDGVIGPNTWAALRSPGAVAANGTPKAPSTPVVGRANDVVGAGPSAGYEFEPLEIVGQMPSRGIGGWWAGLSPIAKAATATLGLGVGLMVFMGGGKRR